MLEGVDGYCERLGPGLWAEPLNAVTNAAFLIAAIVMWRRTRAGRDPLEAALIAILAAIAIGSGLFHTIAQGWAGLADVIPIAFFILGYVYAANRRLLGLRAPLAVLLTLGYFPYAAATVPLFGLIPGLGGSAAYAPVPLLILIYAALLARRLPGVACGLALGACLLALSLAARTLDGPLCAALPVGSHFVWHLLNAAMLGWMIEVLRRHRTCSPWPQT